MGAAQLHALTSKDWCIVVVYLDRETALSLPTVHAMQATCHQAFEEWRTEIDPSTHESEHRGTYVLPASNQYSSMKINKRRRSWASHINCLPLLLGNTCTFQLLLIMYSSLHEQSPCISLSLGVTISLFLHWSIYAWTCVKLAIAGYVVAPYASYPERSRMHQCQLQVQTRWLICVVITVDEWAVMCWQSGRQPSSCTSCPSTLITLDIWANTLWHNTLIYSFSECLHHLHIMKLNHRRTY